MDESTPSLTGLFVETSNSSGDDASTKVDEANEVFNDDNVNIGEADRDLSALFEERMRDNAKMRSHCHSKVAVLLIDWEKKSEGYLDTGYEVNRLAKVFKKKYNFTVWKRRLNTDAKQNVSKQMEKFLMDFTYQLDGDDTLLIIYYAGHGLTNDARPGELSLHPSSTRPFYHKKQQNYIVWNKAEERIKETEADILLIFDCCYAGELARKRGVSAWGKIFEFLGSAQWYERAWGPGPNSFTSALIWALNEYAEDHNGFTLRDLEQKIQSYPDFQCFPDPQHHQVPCISDRGDVPALQILKICAMYQNPDETRQHRQELAQQQPERPKFYLNLEFVFSSCPTEDDVKFLVKQLRNVISHEGYPLLHVLWHKLLRQDKHLRAKWKVAAQQALTKHRNSILDSAISPIASYPESQVIIESPTCVTLDASSDHGSMIPFCIPLVEEEVEPAPLKLSQGLHQVENQKFFHAFVFIQRKSWICVLVPLCLAIYFGILLFKHLTFPYFRL